MSLRPNTQHQAISLKRRFLSLPTLLFFLVAIALIYFLTTRFELDRDRILENLRATDPWLYLLAFLAYYLSFGVRGLRWRILARNAGIHDSPDARLPSVTRASQLILMGWFVNSVAPLRLGDAYRAYAFSEDSGGGFSWSLGTVLAERVLDMATVFVLIVAGVAWYSLTRSSGGTVYILGAALLMSLTLAVPLAVMKGYGARLTRFLPRRLEASYHRFHKGALGSLKQLPVLTLLGLIAWLLEVGRLYFVVHAMDLSISLPLVILAALGHAVLSTVPSPGGIGAVEPGVTGILVLGLERNDAVSAALVDRSITYASVIIIGLIVFLLWHVSHARGHRRESRPVDA